MTATILLPNHAPTHSSLERSCLLKEAGKNVTIMSTTEGAYETRPLPFYLARSTNKIDRYDQKDVLEFKGEEFSFYQGKQPPHTKEGLQNLIDKVEEICPYYILHLGGSSYVADILSEIYPVATIATVFSSIPQCSTPFIITGKTITEEERKKYKNNIIEVPFTFELREKEKNFTREQLGIPEDKFVLATVGGRLDVDIQEDFLSMLNEIEGIFLLLIGKFDSCESRISEYPYLAKNYMSTGLINEVIGRLECADLYVNPRRLGGGFSAIEAFHAGIPVVTVEFGDVAVAVGKEFCVKDYIEMKREIGHYMNDPEYYQKKVAWGKEREREMTENTKPFLDAIERIENHRAFY